LWPEETAQFIIKNNIKSIMGNECELILKHSNINETVNYTLHQLSKSSLNWLKTLPESFTNEFLTLFHGSPNDMWKYFLEKIDNGNIKIKTNEEILENCGKIKTKYIGFGHSHVERIVTIGEQIFINAGSVGLPAYSDENPDHKMETYNNLAKYIIIENDNIQICAVAYDYKSSSRKANENNRNDWSEFIETGRVIS
jgi:hypothetical protein